MPFLYRTYSQLHADLVDWSGRLPSVSAVSGVPRSGVIVAAMLAQILHCPLLPIEALVDRRPTYRPRVSRQLAPLEGPILLVDDTCSRGRTRREVQQALGPRPDILYGAVYATPHAIGSFRDLVWGFVLPTRWHTFEWNLLKDGVARTLAVDMDGILCHDWTGGPSEVDGRYEAWLREVTPLRLPTAPIGAIVTNRLERWRPQTEAWLARHGVRYGQLRMHPGTAEERSRDWMIHKIRTFRELRNVVSGFVESEYRQAEKIAQATGWSVLHMASGTMWNGLLPRRPSTFAPSYLLPSA